MTNGPVLSLSGGAQMTVHNDFLTLSNMSKVSVVGGPLIAVNGTGSKLTIDRLVNFSGTGNQVIVNNSITPTQSPLYYSGGYPVTIPMNTSGGGAVTITGTSPVKNVMGNTFSVSGSAIKATNGGSVTITAP